MKFSKFMVTFIILLVVTYTGLVLGLIYTNHAEPTVLTGCFFGFATGELWALATITKVDKKNQTPLNYVNISQVKDE